MSELYFNTTNRDKDQVVCDRFDTNLSTEISDPGFANQMKRGSSVAENTLSLDRDTNYQLEKIRERFGNVQLSSRYIISDNDEKENVFGLSMNIGESIPQQSRTSRFFPETISIQPSIPSHSIFPEGSSVKLNSSSPRPIHRISSTKPILKMTNIPWEISTHDVLSFFRDYAIASDGVHIPIDRCTGKTKNEVYVEFNSFHDLLDALARRHRQIIKSREIFLNRSSLEELLKVHFPKARVEFGEYITAEEISSVATICKYYKIHFSRKCAERPFEHVMSVIKLLPWSKMTIVTKDQCYELLEMSLEALISHLSRPNSNIDESLIGRMVNCGLEYAILNEIQKQYLESVKNQVSEILMSSRNIIPSTRENNLFSLPNNQDQNKNDNEENSLNDIISSQTKNSLLKTKNKYEKENEELNLLVETLKRRVDILEREILEKEKIRAEPNQDKTESF